MEHQELTGFLLINKPKDITSFSCVNHIKKICLTNGLKIKIGHAGTLDPFATGLLIICIGRQATRSIHKFMDLDKEYVVTAKLGELTDTLDLTGTVLKYNNNIPSKDELLSSIKTIGKEYLQIPPVYSALKHKGQPLYKLVREKKLNQEELEKIAQSKERNVKINKLEITDYSSPYFSFIANVSKGTYIRSLANDIAKLSGSCATTYKLERTKIGDFKIENAIHLKTIKTLQDIEQILFQI
jgi:tRNA pseudouridine55 synthase